MSPLAALRYLSCCLILGLAPFSPSLLCGQSVPPVRQEQSWNDGMVVICTTGRDGLELMFRGLGGQGNRTLKTPKGAISARVVRGVAWAVVPTLGDDCSFEVYKNQDNGQWVLVGRFLARDQAKRPQVCDVFPVSDTRFILLLQRGGALQVGSDRGVLGIGELNLRGEIVLKSIVALPGHDAGVREAVAVDRDGFLNSRNRWLFHMMVGRPMLTVDDQLVLFSALTGTFFVFDHRGSLRRTIDLYESLLPMKEKSAELEWAVLCAQPRQDGRILIAARTEDACLVSRKLFQVDTSLRAFKDPEARERNRHASDQAVRTFTEITWWSLDPTHGTVRREPAPLNVPALLEDSTALRRFRFTFKPNGDLEFPDGNHAAGVSEAVTAPTTDRSKEGK